MPRKSRKVIFKGSAKKNRELSVNSHSFNGTFHTAPSKKEESTKTVKLTYTFPLATGAGTTLFTAVDKDPSAQAARWGQWAVVYDEYRVLGMRLNYHPRNRYSTNSAVLFPSAFVCVDHDDATTPVLANVLNKESCEIVGLDDPWWYEWRMDGNPEDTWYSTSSPATGLGSIKIAGGGTYTTATTYGDVFIEYMVQFKGIQ